MNATEPMVIVGAGQCGVRAAQALRENGWKGGIALLGDEGLLPYERPPLSKSVLLGNKTTSQCTIHDETFFREQRIDLHTDAPAVAIDRVGHRVVLASGDTLGYHRLLIATGARPRLLDLPGAKLAGVHVLRGVCDTHAISAELRPGRRIAVIGAGFIGLEIAATAVALGCEVVLLEAAPRALMRAVPEVVAECLMALHRQRGVDIRFGAHVECLLGTARVSGVGLVDGTTLACDAVIVGIGVTPCTELAREAKLDVENGIAVDATLCTNDPRIFSAGDVCSFPHPLFGRRIRLECWKNAEDQARVVARNMLGHGETCSPVPWFWSDQYDVTIHVTGMPTLGATTAVRETGPGSQVFFALDGDGVLVGASGVGRTGEIARDVRFAQELIARRARVEPHLLADRGTKLRSLLAAEAQ